MALTKITSDTILDGTIANVDLASDIAVTGGQVADDAVTLAKMAGLARGSIILGDASGDPSAKALGASTYVLTSDGSDADWAAIPAAASGGFIKWTPVVASIDPFALQSGTTKVILEVQASGGTAGNESGPGYTGGSGGAGAYARKLLTGMTGATDQLDIDIGAVPATNGTAGTTTSVAAAGTATFATVTCAGGQSGYNGSGSAYGSGGAGGAIPTTGDLNIKGQNGTFASQGKTGASSLLGVGGAKWEIVVGPGDAGSGYGAGGGQGYGASQVGGAGAPAIVMVWEYK